MAAPLNLPNSFSFRKSGVLTLRGFGIKVRVDRGHLALEDGIGPDRRTLRLPRVGHGLKRLVLISDDGYISLNAIHWLVDQNAAFVMLRPNGKVLACVSMSRSSDAHLRRVQAQAHDSGVAVLIAKELIGKKLENQEQLARYELHETIAADAIKRLRDSLANAESIETIRSVEARAAHSYWSAFAPLPILWPKRDLPRVPENGRVFGSRTSPLSGGSPRLSANPPNSLINYLGAILESEARLSITALGLDPGLGVLHSDNSYNSGLAFDIMEPCRVDIERWVLKLLRSPLSRKWFFETNDGQCRLTTSFIAEYLSPTAPIWARTVAPWAEFCMQKFFEMIPRCRRAPATRLTQSRKRAALSQEPVSPVVLPIVSHRVSGRYQAFAQACAFPSPSCVSISEMGMFRQLRSTRLELRR